MRLEQLIKVHLVLEVWRSLEALLNNTFVTECLKGPGIKYQLSAPGCKKI